MEADDRHWPPVLATASGAAGASSSGPGWSLSSRDMAMAVEQSPVHAPSETSWLDDGASSLATCSPDATITVNTQRLRCVEHLKSKLEGMIRQRFENYLQIVHVYQNETGKLASLECDLGGSSSRDQSLTSRISISCNEDSTFFVYTEAPPEAAGRTTAAASSSSPQASQLGCHLQIQSPGQQDQSLDTSEPADCISPSGAADTGAELQVSEPGQLRHTWVAQVCEFGMSGRCQSLTALFHFGYTAWSAAKKTALTQGSLSVVWGADASDVPEKIAEEEDDAHPSPRPLGTAAASNDTGSPKGSHGAEDAKEGGRAGRSVGILLQAAQQAADDAQHALALDYCNEAISAACSQPTVPMRYKGCDAWVSGAAGEDVQPVLLLRARVQTHLLEFDLALQDAERLISLQPTCAEGYYWQSVALNGMHRGQEALEALMNALEYDPQNALFQHHFTLLFEEISSTTVHSPPATGASSSSLLAATPSTSAVLHGRRIRGSHLGDAQSQTTQATHMSSRSTTPTEVSAAQSRSSTQDSLEIIGFATEDQPT